MVRELNKAVDSIAYVVWALALWMLSYYQLLDVDFEVIQNGYVITIFLWIIVAVRLYGSSLSELNNEVFKSLLILIGSYVFGMVYSHTGTLQDLVSRVVIMLLYQLLIYVVYFMIRRSKNFHGKYAKRLAYIYLFSLGFLYFILNWNIYLSLMISSLIGLGIGWKYYLRNSIEMKEMKDEEERLEILEVQKKQRILELENDTKFLKEENLCQKETIKSLKKEIRRYEKKAKRKNRRIRKNNDDKIECFSD